jgi:hypothetical protein
VDAEQPAWYCCPGPGPCLCHFDPDFNVTTDENGYYQVCLEAADTWTAIEVTKPGYYSPWPFDLFWREENGDRSESRDFWFYSGPHHVVEGYIRGLDGRVWTEDLWVVTLRETQGRWTVYCWTSDGHYIFSVPEVGLSFDVLGPDSCGGTAQVRRYESMDRDFHDQDFIVGCPGVGPGEYALYSALIQAELVDKRQPGASLIVLDDSTRAGHWPNELPVAMEHVREEMPGLSRDLAANFISLNAHRYRLGLHFSLGKPMVLLSYENWSQMIDDDGWDAFFARYPSAYGFTNVSRASFSISGDTALVFLGNTCFPTCTMGYYYLMTKSQGTWSVEDRSLAWAP